MEKVVDIALSPREAVDPVLVREAAAEAAAMPLQRIRTSHILKRSIDARSKRPLIRLRVQVSDEEVYVAPPPLRLPDVHGARRRHLQRWQALYTQSQTRRHRFGAAHAGAFRCFAGHLG